MAPAKEEGFKAALKAMLLMSPHERRRDFHARAHTDAYVRDVLADAGLALHTLAGAELREEAAVPARGWVVTAARAH